MLTSTKRTIAVMTAAACLGGAGWAVAVSSGGGSGTDPATGQPDTQVPSLAQDAATPPTGRSCPNHAGGGGGGGGSAAPSPGGGGGLGDGTGVPPAAGGQSEI